MLIWSKIGFWLSIAHFLGRGLGAHSGLAGGDCGFAFEEQPGAFDDRDVDHLVVDGDRTHTFGQRLVIGGDDAPGAGGFLTAWPAFFVQDRHLARMDDRGADEAETAGPADRMAESVEVMELGDRANNAAR